eukprot:Gb_23551 [translate_table: standard]
MTPEYKVGMDPWALDEFKALPPMRAYELSTTMLQIISKIGTRLHMHTGAYKRHKNGVLVGRHVERSAANGRQTNVSNIGFVMKVESHTTWNLNSPHPQRVFFVCLCMDLSLPTRFASRGFPKCHRILQYLSWLQPTMAVASRLSLAFTLAVRDSKIRLFVFGFIYKSIKVKFSTSTRNPIPNSMEEYHHNPAFYTSLLQECATAKALEDGKRVHAHMLISGLGQDGDLGNKLVSMYGKCGSLVNARKVFEQITKRNVFSWTAIIGAYVRHGHSEEAFALFRQMQLGFLKPDSFVIAILLSACTDLAALEQGKEIHNHIIKSGFESSVFVGSCLVDMYAKCGSLEDARDVFDKMPERNVVSWTTMIASYAQNGHGVEALKLFSQMQLAGIQPNLITWNATISAYAQDGHTDEALKQFQQMQLVGLKPDVISWNALIGGSAQNGRGDEAMKLFHQMLQSGVKPNLITIAIVLSACADSADLLHGKELAGVAANVNSWNAMITGYAQHEHSEDAFKFFHQMQLEGGNFNSITITSILSACTNLVALQQGKVMHAHVVKRGLDLDVSVANALTDMYAKCGNTECARLLFDKMSERDVVSWNAMLAAYAHNGLFDEAFEFFHQMQLAGVAPNSVTLLNALPACANSASLQQVKEIHGYTIRSGFKHDLFLGSAIVDRYAKSGIVSDAQKVFDKMSQRDVVSWNSIIAGYAQNGFGDEALKLFQQMQLAGLKPDVISWSAVIAGYAQNGHGDDALKLFHQMQLTGVKPTSITISGVLAAFASLAVLQQGKGIHNYTIKSGYESDVFVGNALIDMYAKCGSVEDAWLVFEKMPLKDVVSWNTMIVGYAMHGNAEGAITLFYQLQQTGIEPNHITFTGVLSACSHAGLVDEGKKFFNRMIRDYCITLNLQHCACMVDLLGRAGFLNEAHDFINNMPFEPNASVWGALLGACRKHCNTELGELGAERLFLLEPGNAGNYVLLSNIYAAAGRWHDAAKMINLMKDRGLRKKAGCSWIEMEAAGYVPNSKVFTLNVEKKNVLCGHCKKLSIASEHINSCSGTPIWTIKNLICVMIAVLPSGRTLLPSKTKYPWQPNMGPGQDEHKYSIIGTWVKGAKWLGHFYHWSLPYGIQLFARSTSLDQNSRGTEDVPSGLKVEVDKFSSFWGFPITTSVAVERSSESNNVNIGVYDMKCLT